MKFVPPLVPPFVDGTSKVWHVRAPVRVAVNEREWYVLVCWYALTLQSGLCDAAFPLIAFQVVEDGL